MKFITIAKIYAATVMAVLAAALLSKSVFAVDPGQCYAVSNPDARALCRAKAHADSSICYIIQDADRRAACLAETR